MNVQPHHGAFAALPKQNDKCLTKAGRGGGGWMGMFGIDRAIKNKDVWFSFHVLMQKVIFFSEGNERLNVFALAHGIYVTTQN